MGSTGRLTDRIDGPRRRADTADSATTRVIRWGRLMSVKGLGRLFHAQKCPKADSSDVLERETGFEPATFSLEG